LKLKRRVCVVVADTDKTFRFRNFFFTPRPNPVRGVHSVGGVVTYVLGRMLRLRKSSTPLAVAGCRLMANEALAITNVADKARGPGSGATVWDMASRFHVGLGDVTWEMLSQVEHKPIVIIRKTAAKQT